MGDDKEIEECLQVVVIIVASVVVDVSHRPRDDEDERLALHEAVERQAVGAYNHLGIGVLLVEFHRFLLTGIEKQLAFIWWQWTAIVLLVEVVEQVAEAGGDGDERGANLLENLVQGVLKAGRRFEEFAEQLSETGIIAEGCIGIEMSLQMRVLQKSVCQLLEQPATFPRLVGE